MNKEFKKGIDELKSIRMTDSEKARMLARIFAVPIKSPYMRHIHAFAYVSSLFLIIALGGATYASGSSLPGDVLYPVKTKIVEPMLNVVNSSPEKKIVWEEEKIERRIVEAEGLAKRGELDDDKMAELERKIEKSSKDFNKAVSAVASSTATSTGSAKEKAKELRQEFRQRINDRKGELDREEKNEENKPEEIKNINQLDDSDKINKLKSASIRVLDEEDKSGEDDSGNSGRDDEGDNKSEESN